LSKLKTLKPWKITDTARPDAKQARELLAGGVLQDRPAARPGRQVQGVSRRDTTGPARFGNSLYNVHMRKYSVSMVRERLAEALDDADRGEPVFIERRGVTYELTVRKVPSRRTKATRHIDILDRAIVEGNWTWEWDKGDLQLRTRRS